MGSSVPSLFVFVVVVLIAEVIAKRPPSPSFDQNYKIRYGNDHILSLHQGREVQMSLDNSSGSSIESKFAYGSGFFRLKMKLPARDCAGVVTAFYLTSYSNTHDELDFEFLGNRRGKPYYLQTNVFTNGVGNREQRVNLWFNPTLKFHTYGLLWNPHQIVFFVDNIPIRVYKNKSNIGVGYPTQPMEIITSIWNGDSWATDGGRSKVNWAYAPFKTKLRSFGINGCPSHTPNNQQCSSSKFFWNRPNFWGLNAKQERVYQAMKTKYRIYDYCTDKSRYPTPPPECPQ